MKTHALLASLLLLALPAATALDAPAAPVAKEDELLLCYVVFNPAICDTLFQTLEDGCRVVFSETICRLLSVRAVE